MTRQKKAVLLTAVTAWMGVIWFAGELQDPVHGQVLYAWAAAFAIIWAVAAVIVVMWPPPSDP